MKFFRTHMTIGVEGSESSEANFQEAVDAGLQTDPPTIPVLSIDEDQLSNSLGVPPLIVNGKQVRKRAVVFIQRDETYEA